MGHNVLAAEPVAVHRVCPRCQSARVYRSHRQSVWEKLQGWLGHYPFRCHACDYRFAAKSDTEQKTALPDLPSAARKRQTRQLVRQLLIAAICMALFLMFLYYLVQPHFSGGE